MTDDIEYAEPGEDGDLYEHHRIVVDKGQSPVRIDKFLTDKIANATRNKVQQGIETEAVRVNDRPVKPSYKVQPLDVITTSFSRTTNCSLSTNRRAWWCIRLTRTGRARWSTP